ncbi:zinc-ribbon domain-containing protein [Winogradskyella rapida]|uniref:Zinc-ribbon domain-containing protein n=1 Tax=Winogradskyella rapida TaxID=549701 RepID=A0ABW3KQW2_9FLAO
MIIVGFKNTPRILGTVDKFECPKCLNNTNWELLSVEKYLTLFFIPIIPTGNEYNIICAICKHQEILSKQNFKNYNLKLDIESTFSENKISENKRNLKLNEINRIIEEDKKNQKNIALQGSKEWSDLASKKSNEELLSIYFKERHKYNPSMIIAVKNEIEKRKFN